MKKENTIFRCWATLGKVKAIEPVGCWEARLQTQELTKEEKDMFTDFAGKLGVFIFSETDVKVEDLKDIPELKGEFKSDKSPSQRLRNVLYVFYQQTHKDTDNFDEFYKRQMEKFIQVVKDKLD